MRRLALILLLFALPTASADEKLAGKACRSVHLNYAAPAGELFVNTVTVEQSAPGTYFAVCGWDQGYYGIQEKDKGKKLLIFSVWDSKDNDRTKLDPAKRVTVTYKDDRVRVGRFGGEGSGGQSFFDYDWTVGTTYSLAVGLKRVADRVEYTAYFFEPEKSAWTRLITFSSIAPKTSLSGLYSFVEDFKRDRASLKNARVAVFDNGWVVTANGPVPVTAARFTADSNPSTAIDAEITGDRFRLATGGDTANSHAKLRETLKLPEAKRTPPKLPEKIRN